MITVNDKNVLETIKNAIVTVPGVKSFAKFRDLQSGTNKTGDITKAMEYFETLNVAKIKIHIILLYGVNIRDVVTEVQIRVKYELEKLSKFTQNFIVDVAVDDLVNV